MRTQPADLDTRLSRYEVTSAPARRHLRLVWVRPTPEPTLVDGAEDTGALAVLDAYRVTLVPGHRARAAS